MTSMQFFHHRENLVLCHGHGIVQNSECVNRFIRMLPFLQRLPRWYKILIYLRGSPTLSSFSLGILLETHFLIFSRFFFSLERGFESKHSLFTSNSKVFKCLLKTYNGAGQKILFPQELKVTVRKQSSFISLFPSFF